MKLTNQPQLALCQGWGLTGYNKRAGSPLRSLKLPVTKVLSYKWITYRLNLYLSSPLCQVDDLWLYTESETDGVIKDTCKGDSGGPLIIDNGGQPLLVGVLEVRHYDIVPLYHPRVADTTAKITDRTATEAGATSSLRGIGC